MVKSGVYIEKSSTEIYRSWRKEKQQKEDLNLAAETIKGVDILKGEHKYGKNDEKYFVIHGLSTQYQAEYELGKRAPKVSLYIQIKRK